MISDLEDSITCKVAIDELSDDVDSPRSHNDIMCIAFATPDKPDINISDVMKMKIDVKDKGSGMVFLNSVGREGVNWSRLLEWYSENEFHDSATVKLKDSFKLRLENSLSTDSPPEKLFFNIYWDLTIGAGKFDLPALLPQVWLQYDSLTARERGGSSAFKHQRMGFMLLLNRGRTIFVEVDGKEHYAQKMIPRPPGKQFDVYEADADAYAKTVASDRDFRLRGYEVFRFGGKEFHGGGEHIRAEIQKLLNGLSSL